MADYYDVESNGDGSYTVTPRDNPGCLSVFGVIIFILVFGAILTRCNNNSNPSSNANQTNQSSQHSSQSSQVPVSDYMWLTDLSPISEDSLTSHNFYDTTSNVGSNLTHCLRTGTKSYGGTGEGWIEYYIGRNYEYLTGYLAITEEFYDTKYTGNLVIYADGTEIYRIDKMVAGDSPIYFELDISNTERILIEHKGGEPFRVANLKLWVSDPTE